MLKDLLRGQGASEAEIEHAMAAPDNMPEDKLVGLRSVIEARETFGPHFSSKAWVLYETQRSRPFYRSYAHRPMVRALGPRHSQSKPPTLIRRRNKTLPLRHRRATHTT